MAYEALDHNGAAGITTLASGISDSATSFNVVSGAGFPTGGGNGNFYVVVDLTEDPDDPNPLVEVIKCSARSTNAFTVATGGRGAAGTTAHAHSSGAKVLAVFTATEAAEANDAVVQTIGKVTTAGDMLVASGANQFARLAKGTDGQVLRMASGAVGWGALPTDSVDSAQIAADAVGSDEIAANAVGASELADNAVDSGAIASNAVTNAKMADNSVDSAEIVAGAIDTVHIGDLQVTTGKLAADAVTGAKLADDSVDSEHLVDGSIDTAHIADGQVTSAKIADGTIVAGDLASNAVTGAKILNANVTLPKIENIAGNSALEGPAGGGSPVATFRGRSWASKSESDSGAATTTPTQIAALNIDAPALVAGRRYKIEFSGQMATTTSTGFAYVQFRKNGNLVSKFATGALSALTSPNQTGFIIYEPGSDEIFDWDIYLEADSVNVKIIASATQKCHFCITDIGLASNA